MKSLIERINEYVLVDLETTTPNPESDAIIEIAALKVNDSNIIDKFSSFIIQ